MLFRSQSECQAGLGFDKPGPWTKLRRWIGPSPIAQVFFLFLVLAALVYFTNNILGSMERLGIKPGFAFLSQRANFEIGESMIAFSSSDSYGRALLAGLLNTITVAFLGCVVATVMGVLLGIAQMSGNLILASAVRAYVEIFRNTPLLLQLFLWSAILHSLPAPRGAMELSGAVYLTNRGIFVPHLQVGGPAILVWAPFAILLAVVAFAIARKMFTGAPFYTTKMTLTVIAAFVAGAWLAGVHIGMELPVRGGFNITGGLSITPEFGGLLAGLVFNSAATIAEIVRSGIQSVGNGQWEAARALGLRPGSIMRLIVLPQALKVITPLMTSSYLDLTKNSSLAVAIGFPDLVSVANTTANTTGQTLEAIAVIATAYLALNLGVSLLMNLYNRRILLREARRT